ncbi:hypothetical protein BDB01DRAFT_288573 [Pilobolus umbonatus]|nr:hypothetical protein BDB01DRAFT_288573 [Pilobolus umbonatus]
MVDQIGDEVILRCGGYSIGNIQSELYHALRAIEENPLFHKKDEMSASKSTVNQQAFHSLSSLPSPKRPVPPNFMQSPMSDQSRFLWSPDHHFATSTPIRAVTRSIMTNPPPKMALAEVDEFDEFDEFDDIDVDAFEEQAMNTVRTGHP